MTARLVDARALPDGNLLLMWQGTRGAYRAQQVTADGAVLEALRSAVAALIGEPCTHRCQQGRHCGGCGCAGCGYQS